MLIENETTILVFSFDIDFFLWLFLSEQVKARNFAIVNDTLSDSTLSQHLIEISSVKLEAIFF